MLLGYVTTEGEDVSVTVGTCVVTCVCPPVLTVTSAGAEYPAALAQVSLYCVVPDAAISV